MKRRMEILMLMAVVFCVAGWADADEPIAHWTLDEGEGPIAYDSAGDNDGTLMNDPVWTAGWIYGALEFDGVDDYVEIPDSPDFTTNTISVAAWVKAPAQYDGRITSHYDHGLYQRAWTIAAGRVGSLDKFHVSLTDTGEYYYGHRKSYETSMPVFDNTWHYVGFTFDAPSSSLKLYVDGIEDTNPTKICDDPITSLFDSSANVTLGCDLSFGSTCHYFNGAIDDARIYDRVLSAEEVWQVYEEGLPDVVGLEIVGAAEAAEDSSASYAATAYYDNGWTKDVTDEAAWSVEPNEVASIEAGLLSTEKILQPEVVTITAVYTEKEITVEDAKEVGIFAICPEGGALKFDGVDDYVNLSENAVKTTEFTIAAWANQYGEGGGAENQNVIFCQRDDAVGDNRSFIGLHADNGLSQAAAGIRSDSGSAQVLRVPKKAYSKWHHYAMTVGTEDFIFYIDGVEVARTSNNQSGVYTTSIDHVYIGRYMYEGGLKGSFNGAIDDVRIYDRALSAEEVQVIMHARPAVDEPNLVGYWDFDEGEGQVAYDTSGSGNDGQLGSAPDADGSDPNWAESDAPVGICTLEQHVERNVNEALEIKLNILDEILEAMAREDASLNILDGLFGEVEYGYADKSDIVTAKQEIHSAIQSEEQASHSIEKSVGDLEDALDIIGSEDGPPDSNSENENRLTERNTVQSGQ